MRRFSYQPTSAFEKKLLKIEKSDPKGYARIRLTIERLLTAPEDSDGKMTGPHRGKLKKYAGRKEYRLIYNWCEACRKANRHVTDTCSLCGTIPDHSVVFLDLFHKSDHVRLGY